MSQNLQPTNADVRTDIDRSRGSASPREPKALTPEYHKARKQLMLWSGILFIWELVGIDLEKGQEAGGNAGAVIKSIKNPRAVPWALLVLVLYFAFKLVIEWRQCSLTRRNVVEAKIDFLSACALAIVAATLYLIQTLSHIEIANTRTSVILGAVAGVFLWLGLVLGYLSIRFRDDYWNDRPIFFIRVGITLVFLGIASLLFSLGNPSSKSTLLALVASASVTATGTAIWRTFSRLQQRQLQKQVDTLKQPMRNR